MTASRTTIDSSFLNGTATLKVDGDTAARDRVSRIHNAVANLVQRGARTIVVDLSNARWLGAAMLGELVASQRTVSQAGGRMRLSGLQRRAARVLAATRLDTVFETT
jgi:anti-sigma B factor antagonist